MFNWSAFTLFLYILMRMSGFVLFSPFFGRSGIPVMFRAGLIMTLSAQVYALYGGTVPVPATVVEFAVRLLLEMGAGLLVAFIMRFFFFVPEQAGEVIDTQMGMSMAKTYDAGAQASVTITANLLNMLAVLLFFTANGHLTLLRMLLTSGELAPFGAAALGEAAANRVVELFAECMLLGVKLSLPILAAELLGQVGMGVLMKVIPQINIFAINIELKVLIGFSMLIFLLAPMSNFLLEMESTMLSELRAALLLTAGPLAG